MPISESIEKNALDLIEKAFALPLESQASFLVAETAHDTALKERVMSIWKMNKTSPHLPKTGIGLNYSQQISRPSTIGTFEIIDELGSGGMGAVYLGRKNSDDFEFYAAIKVVRKDALSGALIERLRTERRTLANLRHPNIAHFYDGGEMENGNPFFVMEYVKGQKLDDYLQNHEITLKEKLKIFQNICSAVAFAHQNLVIHRDLAPSNIMVAEGGLPKLIDFGIALTLDNDIESTISSKTGTQGYIAPELNEGNQASTISDIYSLGVLLRELIHGQDTLRKSDLEAISKKASNNDPQKRYQSVDALLQDLVRYSAGDAVLAVEPSRVYFVKRFVGKHRVLVTTAASIFIVVLLAFTVVSIAYVHVEEAEKRSSNRFNEVRELANFMMFDLYGEVSKLDTSLVAREMLMATSLNYLDGLSVLPEAPLDLRIELALGYQRMADIAGGAGAINFGERAKAGNLYSVAKEQIDLAYKSDPKDPQTVRALAQIYRNIGTFEWISNLDFEKARANFAYAKAALQNLLASPVATVDDHVMNGALAISLSQSARNISDFAEAIAWSEDAIDTLSSLLEEHPGHYEALFNLAHAYVYLGEAITTQVYELGGDINRTTIPFQKGKQILAELSGAELAPTLAKAQYTTALYKSSKAGCQLEDRLEESISDLKVAEKLARELMKGEAQNNFVEERLLLIFEVRIECELKAENIETSLNLAQVLEKRRQEKVISSPRNPLYIARLIDSRWLLAKIYRSKGLEENECSTLNKAYANIEDFDSNSKHPPAIQLRSHMDDIKSQLAKCV